MGNNLDYKKYGIREMKRVACSTGKSHYSLFLKSCQLCSGDFWARKPTNTFCSRKCSNTSLRKIQDPLEHFFREKITRLKHNAKGRGIALDVTWQDLKEAYEKQNGRCFYSGEVMSLVYSTKTHKVCPPEQLSVDRMDSTLPYTKSNVVLCCYNINNFKGDMNYKSFIQLLEGIFKKQVNLKFKKLDPKAVVPSYAKSGDAAVDLTATSLLETGLYIEYGTGLAIELPERHVGLIYPRSSISNYHLALSNSVGVVDSGYRGEVKFRFKKTSTLPGAKYYQVGDRIGQLIVQHIPEITFEEAEELSDSNRGGAGYGSSGK